MESFNRVLLSATPQCTDTAFKCAQKKRKKAVVPSTAFECAQKPKKKGGGCHTSPFLVKRNTGKKTSKNTRRPCAPVADVQPAPHYGNRLRQSRRSGLAARRSRAQRRPGTGWAGEGRWPAHHVHANVRVFTHVCVLKTRGSGRTP